MEVNMWIYNFLHINFSSNCNCKVPGQLKEGAATKDGTLEVEAFVAELAEVD